MEETLDQPDLRHTPEGWLAVANDHPRVAVVAETAEEARKLFQVERAHWRELIALPSVYEENVSGQV